MKSNNESELDRRKFLTTTTAAVIGAGCFSVGLKEAIADAAATGRILLTVDNLNRLFRQKHEAGEIRSLAREIRRDTIGWLRSKCSLTPIQERRIAAFTNKDWDRIKEVFAFVEDTGGTLSINFWEETPSSKPSPLDPYWVKVQARARNPNGTTTTREATVNLQT